jgi:regulator of protease activity HflC (stomatin/prohibitin superfamily)
MDGDMGFPSKDGFWVTLDGIVEYRVRPDQASKVLVTYNETSNDRGMDANVSQEIVNKIILPNARSFCRLRGSDHSGQDFIKGDTRSKFQEDFQRELQLTCESQGVQIIQALITRINPPQKIAEPVRQREIALQKKKQFEREILQQTSEQQLAVGQEMVKRKQELVDAERSVIKVTTEAKRRQEVAVIEAEQRLKVAELELQAAQDMAEAARALGEAEAQVIEFDNQAEAAGWKKAISAFGGDGDEYAQWTMLKKLAPSFRQMMVNTADSPLMEIFRRYQSGTRAKPGELLGRQSESEQRPAAATSPAGTTVVPGDLGSAAREN